MMRIWFPWSGENESRLQNLQKRKRQRGRRVLQDISPDDDDVFGGFSDDNLDFRSGRRDVMISVDRGPLPPGRTVRSCGRIVLEKAERSQFPSCPAECVRPALSVVKSNSQSISDDGSTPSPKRDFESMHGVPAGSSTSKKHCPKQLPTEASRELVNPDGLISQHPEANKSEAKLHQLTEN
ncbi:unnamed protein product [Microthlaspi erraticum]|uniref:Uncharacterized protein n=1 Tax=Microthlaspi erraticum TaxID=1685480 RepID=A0A6D2L192_9BRAS|nr:unnamed protein product [Microthlaspi erraticum]